MLFVEFDIVVLYIWLHGLNSHGLIAGLRYFLNREIQTGSGGCLASSSFKNTGTVQSQHRTFYIPVQNHASASALFPGYP